MHGNATSIRCECANLVTQLVTLNWMALNGGQRELRNRIPMPGLGAATRRLR